MGKSVINIKRDSRYAGRLRRYKVILDGQLIGDIADGQSKSFDISPGSHTLHLKVDLARSNKVRFEAAANKTIHFRCANSITGFKIIFAIVYATILIHRYIELERID